MVRQNVYEPYDGKKAYVEFSGVAADSKPTTGIINGSLFFEVDTGKVYAFNEASSTWVEQFSFQS